MIGGGHGRGLLWESDRVYRDYMDKAIADFRQSCELNFPAVLQFPVSPPLGDQAGPTETNLVAPIAALTETNSPSAAEIPVLPASDAAMAATKAATIGSLISAMAGSDFSAYAGNAVISSQVSVVGDSFSPIAGSSMSSMSIGSEQKISSLV